MLKPLKIFRVKSEQFRDFVNIHRGDDSGIVDLFAENGMLHDYLSPFTIDRLCVGQDGQ